MKNITYQNNILCIENIPTPQIAEQFGTPCYVYSYQQMLENYRAFAASHWDICYAVKANSNLAILHELANLGAGFDIVSGGELTRVIAAHGDPQKTIFSGVGKSADEIRYALQNNIGCFNVESTEELSLIAHIAAELRTSAPIALRVNPDVDAKTHPYIATGLKHNKFGIAINDALSVYQQAQQNAALNILGIACHIGSQMLSLDPISSALEQLMKLCQKLDKKAIHLQHIDIGGGLGVRYQQEKPPAIADYITRISDQLKTFNGKIIAAPGRALIANSGVLLTRLLYKKQTAEHHFAIIDAAMNDLMRPALYNAWHAILACAETPNVPLQTYDVVGPVCESSDVLAKTRELRLSDNALLVFTEVGAYGFSMSSNYNSRPRPAEVLVKDGECHLIRPRETVGALFAQEILV